MTSAALIPDRRRKYFPRNGGPRPTESHRQCSQTGIAAAREALAATIPPPPGEPKVIKQLTPEQVARARKGIAAARNALMSASGTEDTTVAAA